ncbi:MAG: O-antigen ligase family protein [Steroidobacteraceae bacterium]
MASLIGLLIAVQMTLDVLKLEVGLAPGLSLKNALLYLVAAFIAVRMVLQGGTRFELRSLQISYVLLIAYAVLTWALASTLLGYQPYPVLTNAMAIKGWLADYFLFFLVCFYGLRTEREATAALQALLLVVSMANLVTLLDSSGLTDLGLVEIREDGRVQGALGESNQYAAFLAFFIPILAAVTYTAHGAKRVMWAACTAMAAISMMITVSRGGFLGLGLAIVAGCWLFRRQVNVGKLAAWGTLSVVVLLMLLFAVDSDFRALVMDRVVEGSARLDPGGITSGRTEVWSDAVGTMLGQPITLLTGFGWNAYFSMPFEGAPHNTYLNYWFNLGVPGVACLLVMYVTLVKTATTSARIYARGPERYWFIGFVVGTLGVCIAIAFVELYQVWIYVWSACGIVMRLAMIARQSAATEAPGVGHIASGSAAPVYGWNARSPALAAHSAPPRR